MSENTALEATPEAKRGPGRPAKTPEQSQDAAPSVKKGKPTWKPASVINVKPREGFTPRMINKDPDNMARKLAEGWEVESGLNAKQSSQTEGYGRIHDGKPVSTVTERHDCILGWMPNDQVEARREFYADRTQRLEQALTREAKSDMAKATGGKGAVHGAITIEKRGNRTVID